MTADTDFEPAAEAGDSASAGAAFDLTGTSLMNAVDQLPEIGVPVDLLVPGFHLRMAGTDAAHVRLLADAAGAVPLPPILVQKRGLRIIDGMHRVEVAKLRGEPVIRARIVDCSDEKALVLAVKSNTLHGLPLTRADRISSAKRILGAHPDWSDRKVAGIAGLSGKSVASLRNSSAGGAPFDGKRLGRDGKRRPMVAVTGRLRAAEYIRAHPEASVREIARETDVSPGTAHDVRKKIRCGVNPGTAETSSPRAQAAPAASSTSPPVTNIRARATADTVRQLTGAAVIGKLTGDPSLRYTDGGRAFLRWMTQHAMHPDEWREFVDAIPERWLEEVRQAAAAMSEEWGQFANQLGCRQGQEAS
ncbi:MAG TPA: ParB/RepB/Spo0J family partition protein [Streptosporangiaceae bacterium]|nr:ParB/RepB/Spo0J family partition protein [Streptosporangiaceae bacterium]